VRWVRWVRWMRWMRWMRWVVIGTGLVVSVEFFVQTG
jgi:hypothetical protein